LLKALSRPLRDSRIYGTQLAHYRSDRQFAGKGGCLCRSIIGADVECKDKSVGKVDLVILAPETFDVTHLVVKRGALFSRDILVPVQEVIEANADRVKLDLNSDEFERLPDYIEETYLPLSDYMRQQGDQTDLPEPARFLPETAPYYVIPFSRDYPGAPAPAPVIVQESRNVAPGQKELAQGMDVYTNDGKKIGGIDRVEIDDSDKRARSFIIEKGLIFPQSISIPADWVGEIEEDRVVLNRTKQQIDDFIEQSKAASQSG